MNNIARKLTAMIMTLIMVVSVVIVVPVATPKADSLLKLTGKAHVQNVGDTVARTVKENGVDTLVLGTRGRSLRVEEMTLNLENKTGLSGGIEYRVHIQNIGWTNWLKGGQQAGSRGRSLRLEGLQIRLTGELANKYSVRYSAHIQNYGDAQGWIYNGAIAGTFGEALRLEEIKVQIVPKYEAGESETNPAKPVLNYRVHRQDYGWERNWLKSGQVSGTVGQSKRLESITITVANKSINGGIQYRTHIQNIGWETSWKSNGELSGTQGKALRLEAIQIKLTGELANKYDVYYRVHAQNYGWLGWAKNGESSGTEGGGLRLEAIQIALVDKGAGKPAATYNGVSQDKSDSYYKIIPQYSGNVSDFEKQVFNLVNIERTKRGLKPLLMNNSKLNDVADIRAREISVKFDHVRPDGTKCYTAWDEVGLDYWGAGENIAAGQRTPQEVMDAWMNSPGHRANILNASYKYIGVGYYQSNDIYRNYWSQNFMF